MASKRTENAGGTSGRESTKPPSPSSDLRLQVIPVDPHRLFCSWWVGPEAIEGARALCPEAAGDARLTLRILDLDKGPAGGPEAYVREDFPVGAGWQERFFSLRQPGGLVAGALGVKDADGNFLPFLTSLSVTLPEAPATLPATEPPLPDPVQECVVPAEEKPAAIADPGPVEPPVAPAPPPAATPTGPSLDEFAILRSLVRIEGLAPELCRLPDLSPEPDFSPSPTATRRTPGPGLVPATPILDERGVVMSTLAAQLSQHSIDRNTAVASPPNGQQSAAAIGSGASSFRLASQVGAHGNGAPMRLSTTLVISGRVGPGHRLRMGNQEIELRADGGFTCQRHLESFPSGWSILLQLADQAATEETPSFELLSRLPDAGAVLTLDSYVEIEGELLDPSYRSYLPRGVNVDAAGRFRVVRHVPPGALFLPHLVLIATPAAP
ncbi:MAG: DUF4912 domain-containing protein [Opitutaceae bacterium]|nr:DUF4912 domain-containing protein [Opitutaceae bacterium]